MKKLTFTSDGLNLLHSTKDNTVAVWSMQDHRLRYVVPGSLVGISRDGHTFLTLGKGVGAWDMLTGKQIALKDVDIESYELFQRTAILAGKAKLTLEVYGVLSKQS